MEKLPGNSNGLLALAITEFLLTFSGFAANGYNLFYGVLSAGNHFPVIQTLAFAFSIFVYLGQLVAGVCFVEAWVQRRRGHRDVTSIIDREMLCVGHICGVYLLIMISAWFFVFLFQCDVAKLGVGGAMQHAVQVDRTAEMVMLGSLVMLIASMFVTYHAVAQYAPVCNDPKLASTDEKQQLLVRADGRNMLPSSYESVETKITV